MVPEPVTGPPDKPVPVATEVTVPEQGVIQFRPEVQAEFAERTLPLTTPAVKLQAQKSPR